MESKKKLYKVEGKHLLFETPIVKCYIERLNYVTDFGGENWRYHMTFLHALNYILKEYEARGLKKTHGVKECQEAVLKSHQEFEADIKKELEKKDLNMLNKHFRSMFDKILE